MIIPEVYGVGDRCIYLELEVTGQYHPTTKMWDGVKIKRIVSAIDSDDEKVEITPEMEDEIVDGLEYAWENGDDYIQDILTMESQE